MVFIPKTGRERGKPKSNRPINHYFSSLEDNGETTSYNLNSEGTRNLSTYSNIKNIFHSLSMYFYPRNPTSNTFIYNSQYQNVVNYFFIIVKKNQRSEEINLRMQKNIHSNRFKNIV